jgi:hypothetical protein
MSTRRKFFTSLLFLVSLVAASACDDPAGAPATCGDGVVGAAEACDDGNSASEDGCSASCRPEEMDCAGAYAGTAAIDDCGICAGGNTGVTPCADTCRQRYGDGAFVDHCGVCVGGDTGLAACVQDCTGEWGGSAATDNCGVCAGGRTGVTPCLLDCTGVYGGTAEVDHCGQCTGGTTGQSACAQDCSGTWGGTAQIDECGACVGGTTGQTACAQDCSGTWGGTARIDECGACVGGTTGALPCEQDCHGDWGGTATIDECATCAGGGTGVVPCEQDCHGDWGGTATIDECGDCAGGNTGQPACVQDCNGQWGGEATIDGCGQCVGGTTGRTACATDCHGDLGGSASIDECGRCVGGQTGEVACQLDCAGVWGGAASLDSCGRCAGGTSGREACVAGTCAVGAGETIASLVANPACTVVQIPAGTYPLNLELTAATMGGKPRVELRGESAATTTIIPPFARRAVTVTAGRALVLRDLKVTGARDAGAPVWNDGELEMYGVEVSGNRASINGAGVMNTGTATIDGSLIADNRVVHSFQSTFGAGIVNLGELEITDSVIRDNRLEGRGTYGAGLYNRGGQVRLTRVSIDQNSMFFDQVLLGGADRGAGIYSAGGEIVGEAVTITNNTIVTTNNRAEGGGLAIVEGRLELSADSVVDGNGVTGVWSGSGGGLFAEHPTELRVAGVSFSGNSASSQNGAEGGAITVLRGSLVLTGNALNRNTVTTTGFQGSGAAAVLIREGHLTASGVTMNGNRVDGGHIRGGLVRVQDMTFPSEADEALVLEDVTANGNVIKSVHGVLGGLFFANDVLVVRRATLHDNLVEAGSPQSFGSGAVEGGLIATRRVNPGTTILEDVEARDNRIVLGNTASRGGLILVDVFDGDQDDAGAAELRGCRLVHNVIEMRTAQWLRGGLVTLARAQRPLVEHCDIRDNAIATGAVPMSGNGSGAFIHGGVFEIELPSVADGQPDTRQFRLEATNVSSNQVGHLATSQRIDGGVLMLYLQFAYGASFDLGAVSSTIFGNVIGSIDDSSLLYVANRSAPEAFFELANVTLATNQVKGRLGVVPDLDSADQKDVTLRLANTIVLGNQLSAGDPCLLTGPVAKLSSGGYNLLDAGGVCDALAVQPGDVMATSSALGDHGDHGGGSYTVAIDAPPALDGGDPAGCRFKGALLATDQRGLPRPAGARCDIGAYERQP